jgi:hypothetical protein
MFGSRKKSKLAAVVDDSRSAVNKSSAALSAQVDELLGTLADKVADARGALSSYASDGAETASKSLDKVLKDSRKGVKTLDRKWKKMDSKQKVLVAGGLLAALAALVAAPTVVKKVRARKLTAAR